MKNDFFLKLLNCRNLIRVIVKPRNEVFRERIVARFSTKGPIVKAHHSGVNYK